MPQQSASLSPRAPTAATMPPSPNASGAGGGAMRPPLMRKQSSQSSHSSRQQNNILSPGSATEHAHPLRHTVRTSRHAKVVLPRNHSSARNLAKLNGRSQVQYADDGRKHARQRSHEGDTEIRLPGSLDESTAKPPMRRNMTAYNLPRNTSHAKLKKNLSHGQLTRLGSGKNLAALNHAAQRAPPSPGLKGKSKRPKSAEMTGIEDISLVQEPDSQRARRPLNQRKNSTKKVGFAVGSAGGSSGDEGALQMEGSGLQEDEWTEDSASASPYSTRQNTANNSRRTSVVVDKTAEKPNPGNAPRIQEYKAQLQEVKQPPLQQESEDEDDDAEEEDSDGPTPLTMGQISKDAVPGSGRPKVEDRSTQPEVEKKQPEPAQSARQPTITKPPPQRSPLHLAKEYTNPTTQRLLGKNQQLPAPALVTNVSALDDSHSSRGSPAPSLRSSRSNIADGSSEQQEDELVSRFVPSGSHPSLGSGPTTAVSTPKQTEFHTPEDGTLAGQQREKHRYGFHVGPVSPGSTVSGSSGATTPAIGRSRTELRMLNEKAMADMESHADPRPQLPAHVYDRRNESLKYFITPGEGRLNTFASGSMGPEVFQGRFRALNTELRVVQKFRDPIGEAVARLKSCKGSRLNSHQRAKTQAATLPMSKSAVSLPAARRAAADLSKSASPPRSGLQGAGQSAMQIQGQERHKQRREVSFARTPPETKEYVPSENELAPDVIARRMWESVG